MKDLLEQPRLLASAFAVVGAAHDLANLLAAISAHARTTLAEPGLPDHARSEIASLEAQAERGACLLRRLLNSSEPEQPFSAGMPVALAVLLDDLAGELRTALGPDRLLTVLAAARDIVAEVDSDALCGVLLELVRNARAATQPGGTLTLSLSAENIAEQRDAIPDPLPPGRYAVISVRDDGEGFPANLEQRAFDLFVTTKPAGEGAGIGLAEARRSLRAMGGVLTLQETGPGRTELRLYLPLVATGAGVVLLVEDEPALRRAAARSFEWSGWQVISAESAEDALSLISAETGPPDLLVTDLALPGIGGFELIRLLRTKIPGLPVILTSGYAEAVHSNDVVVLHKPYEMAALLHAASRTKTAREGQNMLRTTG